MNRKTLIVISSLVLLVFFVATPLAAAITYYYASGYAFDCYPAGVAHSGCAELLILNNEGVSLTNPIAITFSSTGFTSEWKLSQAPTTYPNCIVFNGVPTYQALGPITVIWDTKDNCVIAYGPGVFFIGYETEVKTI